MTTNTPVPSSSARRPSAWPPPAELPQPPGGGDITQLPHPHMATRVLRHSDLGPRDRETWVPAKEAECRQHFAGEDVFITPISPRFFNTCRARARLRLPAHRCSPGPRSAAPRVAKAASFPQSPLWSEETASGCDRQTSEGSARAGPGGRAQWGPTGQRGAQEAGLFKGEAPGRKWRVGREQNSLTARGLGLRTRRSHLTRRTHARVWAGHRAGGGVRPTPQCAGWLCARPFSALTFKL